MSILSYLRFALADDADAGAFEADMERMLELARSQPGFQWAEVGSSPERVWVVLSEWDDVEQVRAWERVEEHSGVMDRWEGAYREPFVHRRFVPWVRPKP